MKEKKLKRSNMVFSSICEYCREKEKCSESSYAQKLENFPPVYECSEFSQDAKPRSKSKKCPCKECTPETGRHPGCYSKCNAYKEWKKGQETIRKKEQMRRMIDDIGDARECKQVARTKWEHKQD